MGDRHQRLPAKTRLEKRKPVTLPFPRYHMHEVHFTSHCILKDRKMCTGTRPLSLQSLPPVSPTTPPRSQTTLKPTLPAHNSTAGTPLYIACATNGSRSRSRNRSPDDYQSTLQALNSKGRVPRKSLGQVHISQHSVHLKSF